MPWTLPSDNGRLVNSELERFSVAECKRKLAKAVHDTVCNPKFNWSSCFISPTTLKKRLHAVTEQRGRDDIDVANFICVLLSI